MARVFAVVVALANTGASGYFAVMGVVDPERLLPGGSAHAPRVFAMYLAARSARDCRGTRARGCSRLLQVLRRNAYDRDIGSAHDLQD